MIEKVDNIILLGTSHVASDSVNEIKKVIGENNPEVVCLELDTGRFKSMMNDGEDVNKKEQSMMVQIKHLGVFGFLFMRVAGGLQKHLGKRMGIQPGIDMKTAYLEAREVKIPVSLIDLPISMTIRKMSKLSFGRKMKMLFSIVGKSMSKKNRKLMKFDLNKVPSDKVIAQMMNLIRVEVPDLYKILIDDRNHYMCKRLLKLRESHEGNIIAVVGAGHVDGMKKILNGKLKSIDEIKDKNSVGFTFSAEFVSVDNINL